MKYLKLIYNILFVALIITVFSSSIEDSFLFSRTSKRNVMHFLPQGWAFFTRNPKEELVSIYQISQNEIKEVNIRNGSAKYAFGLNRKPRVKGYEISLMLSQLKPKDFFSGNFDTIPNIDTCKPLLIETKYPLKCFENGIYVIKAFEPVPWAWSKFNQSSNRPTKYAVIELKNEF